VSARRRILTYRHHKPTGQAVVTIDGNDRDLGKFGTPESRARYDQIIAEWTARQDLSAADVPTVDEIIVLYLVHAERYDRKDGAPTAEIENLRLSLRPLHRLFGPLPARDLGPRGLKRLRQEWIEEGISRQEINRRIGRIRRCHR